MRKITLSLFILFTFYSSICFSQSAKDFYNSGKTKTYSDKFSAAILDFDKAIELDPNYLDAYVSRGFAYLKLKDFTLCLIDFNKAIEIAPDQGYLYDYRGFLYNNIKQYDKSAVDYNKAIELDPKFKDSFVNRGINYLDLNKHDEAIADFNTAMDLAPNWITLSDIVDALMDHNQNDDALAFIKRGDNSYRYSESLSCKRGRLLIRLGQYDSALVNMNNLLSFAYYYSEGNYLRGIAYYRLKEYDKAMNDFDAAFKWSPHSDNLYWSKGFVHMQLDQFDDAIRDFNSSIQYHDNLAMGYLGLSMAYFAKSDAGNAKLYFGKACTLEPRLKDGMNGIRQIESVEIYFSDKDKNLLDMLFNSLN